MWRKAWIIARQFLQATARDRISLIWLLLFPIIWTTLIGAFSSGGDGPTTIGLVRLDSSSYAQAFQDGLSGEKDFRVQLLANEAEAQSQVQGNNLPLALVIPADFGSLLRRGETVTIMVWKTNRPSSYYLDELINKVTRRLAADAATAGFAVSKIAERTALTPSQAAAAWSEIFAKSEEGWRNPRIEVSYQILTSEKEVQMPQGANQASPGFTAMFVLMGLFFGAGSLVNERRDWTLQRLLSTPTLRFSLLFGKFLGFFLLGAVQLILLILYGQFVLGANWGTNPLGIALVSAAYLLAAVGLGTLLAALARTPQQANAFSILLSIVLGMLGGAWWPVEILSPTLQTIAKFTPIYWAVNGYNKLISFGEGIPALLPNLAILLAIAAVSLFLGMFFFRTE